MAGTGMPDGAYRLGEMEVRVKNGRCVIGNDTLAGSTLTLDRAIRNFSEFTGASLQDTVTLIAPGRSADIAVLSLKNGVIGTILRGIPQLGPPPGGVYLNG
jgi:N-acetylglucosamine-6-phosphate deacetylase